MTTVRAHNDSRLRSRGVRGVLVGLVVALGVAACAGGGGGGTKASTNSLTRTGVVTGELATGGTGGTAPVPGPGPKLAGQHAFAGATSADQSRPVSSNGNDDVLTGRDLVQRADLTVKVHSVDAATSRAATLGDRLGGYVSDESVITDPRHPSRDAGSITLRVPQKSYELALRQLAALGTRTSLQRTVSDVTSESIDVASRLRTQRASIDRIRTLLSHATDLGQVISLESELTSRQADLESLEHRLRALRNEVSLATIDATFVSDAASVNRRHRHHEGFLGGLFAGWDAFVDAARGIATALGAVLPFVAFLVEHRDRQL